MGLNLIIANADGSLDKKQSVIKRAFASASQTAQELLQLDKVDVVCISNKVYVIPEIGIGGFTPSRHLTYLYIDPAAEINESEIFNTLCHEFHHARRYDGPGYGNTLFDSIIFEGLATAFENEVSGGKAFISSTLRKRKNTRQLINKCKPHFNDTDFDHFKWFIRDKSGELPRWSGYEMGYFIVREQLAKQNKKASDLVLESPRNFE
ncbi:MAG TPA: DUF2268 domain-containing putative Zn-dependent protease [Candidatus Saccharimonadales bacterium]|nr:DUF2268 domain-containing putative Zn-dependent protease [Candidatus Saccharimonadales bacterium]